MSVMRNVLPIFVLAMMAIGADQAHAFCFGSFGIGSSSIDRCVLHSFGSSTRDPHIADLLKTFGRNSRLSGGAIRSCPWGETDTRYYVLTPIENASRVSYYHQTQLFLDKDPGEIAWTPVPPKASQPALGSKEIRATFMCGEKHSCDRHDAKGFIETEGVSPYLFRTLQDAWRKILKSESVFDSMFDNVRDGGLRSQLLSSLRSHLFKGPLTDKRIEHVCFFDDFDLDENQPDQFEFQVGDIRSRLFLVGYEYADDGISILNLGYAVE